jgi:predicted amidophosphoribosyltransferase
MSRELEYAGARSAFVHEGVGKRLVTEFKFGGQPVLGSLMAELAGPAFRDYAAEVASSRDRLLVTWVPAHRKAERERGYNQAELLARALAVPAGLGCAPLVDKKLSTRHQKGLDRTGRQSNLRGAFALREEPRAASSAGRGQGAVLLVDDVYTTGATAAEMSRVIGAGTGLPVHVFTFSRAVRARAEGHD